MNSLFVKSKVSFRPGVVYIFLSFVINIASTPLIDSTNLRPLSSPKMYVLVDSASPSIDLSDIIVVLISPLFAGYPVLGSNM